MRRSAGWWLEAGAIRGPRGSSYSTPPAWRSQTLRVSQKNRILSAKERRTATEEVGHLRGTSRGQRCDSMHLAQPRGVEAGRLEVIWLEIGIIQQDILQRLRTAQQFQKKSDRIAQPTNARFPVTDRGIDGDPLEQNGRIRIHSLKLP